MDDPTTKNPLTKNRQFLFKFIATMLEFFILTIYSKINNSILDAHQISIAVIKKEEEINTKNNKKNLQRNAHFCALVK